MLDRKKSNSLGLKPSASRQFKNKDLIKFHEVLVNKSLANHQSRIFACDTEDNSKGKTYMVNFFDGDNHYTFKNTEAAIEFIINESKKYKKGVEVWFANIGYDMGNIFREAQDYLSFSMVGSRFITGKIYKTKVKFKDIFNIIPGASVKSLGKMIKLEKMETDSFENEEYCQRDTEIVYWALLEYKKTLSSLNINLKNTAAATGFSALLEKYRSLSYNNFSEEDHEFLKEGYYGGRTEVFNTAKQEGEIYGYDITSSYPNVMRKIPLPNPFYRYYTKKPNFEKEGMVDCVVECPENLKIPYLPLRIENKLCFPTGSFRGTWTYYEIREAKKLGYKVLKINKALEFKINFEFSLKEFIEDLFSKRYRASEIGNYVLQYACKIIMNASYGKFALGNEKTELLAFDELWKVKGEFSSEIFPNNQILVKKVTDHSPQTNFLYAAYITAFARHDLFIYIQEALKNGRIPLYCDTDSIFFKGPKFNLKFNEKLGSLQLKDEISDCQFLLPKTYYVKWTDGTEIYKCKGVKGNLAKEFFTKGFAESMQPLKYVETCRKNFFIAQRNKKYKNSKKEEFIPFNMWVKKPKTLKSKYDKRFVLKLGDTKAIKLNYDLKENTYK